MAGSGTNSVYWDTCIFVALLKGEQSHGDGILDSISQTYKLFQAGKIAICTSTITIAEVAQGQFEDKKHFDDFKNLKYAENFDFREATVPILELTSELKDYYYNNPLGNKGQFNKLSLGDAIQIATAINSGVGTLVTLDGKHKSNGEIGMLKIPSPIAGQYDLDIVKPEPPVQGSLGI